MSITVDEVNNIKFDQGRNKCNYNFTQVDNFLDRVAGEIDCYEARIRELTARCTELEKQIEAYKEKEDAINHTLLEAGSLRASMLKRADEEVQEKLSGISSQIETETARLASIKEEEAQAVKRIKYILEAQMANLDYLANNKNDAD